MSRSLLAGPILLVTLACAGGPEKLYPGPPLPPDEAVLLEAGRGAAVYAIDGRRTFGDSWSLAPGERDVWVRAQVTGRAPNVVYKAWTYCHMRFEAAPGGLYRTSAEKRERLEGALGKEVSIDIRIVAADGEPVEYPRLCSSERPRLSDP